MNFYQTKLSEKLEEALKAVLPIIGIVLFLSFTIAPIPPSILLLFLFGAVLLVIGMMFFTLGAELAMTPMGERVGTNMAKSMKLQIVLFLCFLLGCLITVSEPDLQVLAEQVPSVPNHILIFAVAFGVGFFLAIAVLRMLFSISLPPLLIVFYLIVFGLAFLVPEDFLAVAFDSGGVTTGPMTVPFIMAMGVGLASVRGDKNASSDSFGLVALSSVGPILAVLILGMFFSPGETAYSGAVVADVGTTRDVVKEFLFDMPPYMKEVLISLVPVAIVFALFQRFTRRYPRRQVKRIAVGFAYTYLGLVLFLCGVNVGFAPLGALLGEEIASEAWRWLLVPIGMLIGYYIVKAEPAIQVLNRQVEGVTNGSVSARAMNRCMSWGVAASVGLSMMRVLTGLPIQYIIIPGYLIALLLSRYVPRMFVGIAFDSGGVASGPMTTTFLLPLSIGACQATGGNLMTDAFGVVALVALTPLIAIQLMGILYQYKLRVTERIAVREAEIPVMDSAADDIIEFEEEDGDGGQS